VDDEGRPRLRPKDNTARWGRLIRFLRPWPILVAAAVCFVGGGFIAGKTVRPYVGVALVTVGAVLVGAWVALLADHGHTGTEDVDEPPEDG
jgi:uncharacterized membrane protein